MAAALPDRSWRRQVHSVLDRGSGDDIASRIVHVALVCVIITTVVAVVLESVPELAARFATLFITIEVIALAVFTVEYAARLWTAPEHARSRSLSPWPARLRYAASPGAVVDLVATLPLVFSLFGLGEFKVLLLLRLLRFFKLGRYSPGMASLSAALVAERKALFACFVILMGVMLMAASLMHLVEHEAQPDKFGTIPDAMWWAIVTLTTVGYGDVVPITIAGKAVAAVTAILGLVMLALPVGIVATAFSQEIHRREFVVTWSMIARMPLFSGLNASEIAEIMRFLRAQTVRSGTTIMRRGEPMQSIFFIASGEVELDDSGACRRLDEGHHFGDLNLGEIALAAGGAVAVRAVVSTKLLILDQVDFRSLMARHPELAERLRMVPGQ